MILGIDLGTTYSAGAYLDENGIPQIVCNAEGDDLTPSVVMIEENEVIVGKVAKRNALRFPRKVCNKIKALMGFKKVMLEEEGVKYTPEMLAQYILKKICQDAGRKLRTEIKDVVVTVPAYFTDARRKATEDAVRLAGLNLVGMIDEPTAAALYYCKLTAYEDGVFLVYDFGGGTFDATLLKVNNQKITILRKAGVNDAGGVYFDELLVGYVIDEIFEEYDVDLTEDKYISVRQAMLQDAEECKKELSVRDRSSIIVNFDGEPRDIVITRATFHKLIHKMYNRTEIAVKEMIARAGMKPQDIDKVLMVGGSSLIPYVQENLELLFGKKLSYEMNPNKAVALGAALFGEICINRETKQEKVFEDVCAHAIGILLFRANSMEQYNQVLIPANSAIPVSAQYSKASTNLQGQKTIFLTITEGEGEDPDFVTKISEVEIPLPERLPIHTPVEVEIALDERQMIHLYLTVPVIEFKKEIHIPRISNLTEEELRQMSGLVAEKSVS